MGEFDNVEQVVNDIRAKYELAPVNLPGSSSSIQNNRPPMANDFKQDFTASESIDLRTNYSRLNSGEWIPKFENVLGSTGNEERLARQQSAGEQWYNGINKNLMKAGNYAVDATVGTAVGLFNLASGEGLASAFDNSVSQWVDDLNTELDSALPNYYSNAQKNMGFVESLGTANFWANDFAGGLAFVGGTLISEAAIGVLTGGASLATTLPRIGLKTGAKGLIKAEAKALSKTLLKNADDLAGAGVRNISKNTRKMAQAGDLDGIVQEQYKNLLRSSTLGKVGKGMDIAGFATRSSTFEAGMESRHAMKESIDSYISNYQAEKGVDPSFEELSLFIQDATQSANYVFAGNMAILAPSNLLMFGKLSGIGSKLDKSVNNFGNRIIGIGRNTNRATTGVVETAIDVKKFGLKRNLGRAYKILGKASTEGIFEEGLQGVTSGTMKDYLADKYNPSGISDEFGFWNSLSEAFHEQYTTKEGWKEMFVGMMIGGIGGPALQNPKSLIKDIKGNITLQTAVTDNQKNVDALNQAHLNLFKRMNSGIALKMSVNRLHSRVEGSDIIKQGEKTNIDYNKAMEADTQANWNYLKTVQGVKNNKEILKDYDHMVDNMTISEGVLEDTGMSQDQIAEYKSNLKSNFRTQVTNAKKAKSAVKALGIPGTLKDSKGNIIEIEDVLAHNVFMGMQSIPAAKEVARQLDEILNTSGSYNPLNFYSNLNSEKKGLLDEVNKLNTQIKRNNTISRKLAEQRLDSNTGNLTESQIQKVRVREQKANERLVKLNSDTSAKQERLDQLKVTLGESLKSNSFGIGNTFGQTEELNIGFGVEDMLTQIEDLDNFISALRVEGKTVEAKEVEALLGDFKYYSNSNREFQKLYRNLLDPKFFKTKRGKGLANRILGPKYNLNEDTVKIINDNDEKIRKSLALNGIYNTGTAEETIRQAIENNPELSEREKFRAEAIIRASLMQSSILEATNAAENITIEPTVVKNTSEELSEPDTLETASEIIKEKDNRTNSQQLDDIVSEIIGEVNEITKLGENDELITKEQIKRLNELLTKEQSKKDKLTDEEINELKGLQDLFDQWTNLDGTVVNKVRLSDLVRRKLIYEKSKVEDTEDIYNLEGFESLTIDEFSQRTKNLYYNLLQSYFSVTTVGKGEDNVSIQGITLDTFTKQLGSKNIEEVSEGPVNVTIPFQQNNTPADKITPQEFDTFVNTGIVSNTRLQDIARKITLDEKLNNEEQAIFTAETSAINNILVSTENGSIDIKITVDDRGNLIISKEDINIINNNTPVVIKSTNKNLNTNYSVVLKRNSEGVLEPLKSDFGKDFSEGNMDEDAVYNLKSGDELTMKIDPQDEYNKELLGKVKTKKLSEDKLLEIEEESQEQAENKLKANSDYKALLAEREKLILGKGNKQRLADVNGQLKLTEDLTFDTIYNNLVREATLPKINKKTRQDIREGLVVKLFDSNGNFVGVLKAKHDSKFKSDSDLRFEELRGSMIDNNLEEILTNPTGVIVTNTASVKDVFLGHPQYNFVEQGAELGTEFKDFTVRDLENISDLGFVEEGKLTLRGTDKGVDTTFISGLRKKVGKTPVIIINFKDKKVAFPIKLKQTDITESINNIEEIFYSKLDPLTKGMHIDKILASLGIDINQKGNSLEYFSEDNNTFTEDNLVNLLAKVKNKAYFYNVNNWITSKESVEDILTREAEVNINLNNSFHSPKIVVDYTTSEVSTEAIEKEAKDNSTDPVGDNVAYSVRDNANINNDIENVEENEICK